MEWDFNKFMEKNGLEHLTNTPTVPTIPGTPAPTRPRNALNILMSEEDPNVYEEDEGSEPERESFFDVKAMAQFRERLLTTRPTEPTATERAHLRHVYALGYIDALLAAADILQRPLYTPQKTLNALSKFWFSVLMRWMIRGTTHLRRPTAGAHVELDLPRGTT
jgi:hypothetical protein